MRANPGSTAAWHVWGAILVALLALAASLSIHGGEAARYHPTGDEISLAAQSMTPTWSWFTSGYARYFVAYPEYWEPFSNFIRPITNLVFYAFSCTSCEYWQIAIVNFGSFAAISGVVFAIAARCGHSWRASLWPAVAAMLAVAFWGTPMVYTPGAAFDGVAALLVVGALWSAAAGRWGVAIALLAVGVFTKEAVLPVTVAFAIYALSAGRPAIAFCAAATVAVWAGLRLAAFGTSVGMYVVDTSSPVSLRRVLGQASVALWLPVTYSDAIPFREMLAGHVGDWPLVVIMLANVTAIACAALAIWPGLRDASSLVSGRLNRRVLLSLATLCVICSGLYFVAVRGGARFSYVFFAAFVVALAAAPARRWRTITLAVLIGASALGAVVWTARVQRTRSSRDFQYVAARKLMTALRTAGTAEPIYLANDFVSGHSAPQSTARLARTMATVHRGSSIDLSRCAGGEFASIRTTSMRTGAELSLTTELPPCASFRFEGAAAARLANAMNGTQLARNEQVRYQFPDASEAGRWGGRMTITVRGGAILHYDFTTDEWRLIR